MKRLILPLAIAAALAAGCENRRAPNGPTAAAPASPAVTAAPAEDAPIIESVPYRCGDLPLTLHFAKFQVTVELPDEKFRLAEVGSASGARYASGADPAEVELWHHGEEALLTVRGTRYPPCISERARQPEKLLAEGLASPWKLEWDAASGALRLTREGSVAEGRAERQTIEGGFELRGEAGGEPFTLSIERNVQCTDPAGGLPRPHRARIRHGGLDEAGCAGTPQEFLAGKSWQVTEIDFGFIPASRMMPELVFTPGGAVVGQGFCNRFGGRWRIEDGRLRIEELAATKIACREPELNEAEQQLLEALRGLARLSPRERGQVMFLSEDGARSITAFPR
jgi:heat shock protein HslJ/membrane-bound inhibitor of C-type lysozyme